MTTKSNIASQRFVPGTAIMSRSAITLMPPVEHIAQGERIRALREARHLSQAQVVRGLEEQEGAQVITLRGYQFWEGSKEKKPKGIKWDNAVALAKFYGVSPEVLVSRETGTSPDLIGLMNNGNDEDRLARMEALLQEIRDLLSAPGEHSEEAAQKGLDAVAELTEDEAQRVRKQG